MAVRLSVTLDPELSERIDEFAKSQEVDRNEAFLRLIETGLQKAGEDGFVAPVQARDFRETERIHKNINSLIKTIDDLKKEIRVMHHMINMRDTRDVPEKQQGRLFKKK